MKLQLYYDNLLVGDIAAAFLDQGTWFGDFRQAVTDQDGPLAHRICDFIAFCQEWHARLKAEAACEASEFEQFGDLLRSGLWSTKEGDSTTARIEDAPVFINGEISWRLRTEEGHA